MEGTWIKAVASIFSGSFNTRSGQTNHLIKHLMVMEATDENDTMSGGKIEIASNVFCVTECRGRFKLYQFFAQIVCVIIAINNDGLNYRETGVKLLKRLANADELPMLR